MEAVELMDKLEFFFHSYGYLLVFFASLIEITPLGFSIPGGTLLAIAGFFAYGKDFSLPIILVAGWLGAWITFIISYFLGYRTGYYLVKKLKQEKNAKRAKNLLKKHGATILTTSMLANLTRFWVAYIAGAEKYRFSKFVFYSGVASLAWSSLMIMAGYLAGSGRSSIESGLARLGIISWIMVLAGISYVYIQFKKEVGGESLK